jgi:hypothetical protein
MELESARIPSGYWIAAEISHPIEARLEYSVGRIQERAVVRRLQTSYCFLHRVHSASSLELSQFRLLLILFCCRDQMVISRLPDRSS